MHRVHLGVLNAVRDLTDYKSEADGIRHFPEIQNPLDT